MSGSAPAIWTEIGYNFTIMISSAQGFWAIPEHGIGSNTFQKPHIPHLNACRACLKGRSVTPAMGATNK